MLQSDRTHVASSGKPRELEVATLEVVRDSLAASWRLLAKLAAQLRAALGGILLGCGCPARGHSVIAFASPPSAFDDDSLLVLEAASNPVEIR